MPLKKNDSNQSSEEEALNRFFNEDPHLFDEALENDSIFHTIAKLETLLTLSKKNSIIPSLSLSSQELEEFQADIDIAKAELEMQASKKAKVPEFLLRYADRNIDKPERKQTLLVRLSQMGIQVFESLKDGLSLTPSLSLSPDIRSSLGTLNPNTENSASHVVFEETIQNGQKFFYQMVRETPEEVFLSIKIEQNEATEEFKQVILRKESRFILSNRLNSDGIVNFSGLKEGEYTVEFLGSSSNKLVDLYLIVD